MMKSKISFSWLAVSLLWFSLAMAPGAQASSPAVKLPPESWQIVSNADGIVFNSSASAEPSLQMVCDANCPYCAQLYGQLKERMPEVKVRWVPVAYFKRHSAPLAAAILAAGDPAAALDENYRSYDFAQRNGGYQPVDTQLSLMLRYEQEVLKRSWLEWGGYTPMLLVRGGDGAVYRIRDARLLSIRSALIAAGIGER